MSCLASIIIYIIGYIVEALDIDNLSTEPSPFKRGGQLTRVSLCDCI